MESKKILFVAHCLFGGGAERVLVLLANYFASKGFNVSIFAHKYNGEYFLDKRINVSYHDELSIFGFIKLLHKTVKNENPDSVIAFEYFYNLCAIIACLGLNQHLIVSERNDPSKVGSGFLKDLLRNFLYRFCSVLVCQTEDAMKYFPHYIQNHSVIILNPLKDNLPLPWIGDRKKAFVSFCMLRKQKNIPLMIHGFINFHKNHPEYELHIYGDGTEKMNIENIINSFHAQQYIHLFPNKENIHDIARSYTAFISTSDYEGLSNSMLEAMAIGLPVICTDCPCGGARMVIENGKNGILIPVGSEQRLLEALSLVADNEELVSKMSGCAIESMKQLSIENIGEQWHSLIP